MSEAMWCLSPCLWHSLQVPLRGDLGFELDFPVAFWCRPLGESSPRVGGEPCLGIPSGWWHSPAGLKPRSGPTPVSPPLGQGGCQGLPKAAWTCWSLKLSLWLSPCQH